MRETRCVAFNQAWKRETAVWTSPESRDDKKRTYFDIDSSRRTSFLSADAEASSILPPFFLHVTVANFSRPERMTFAVPAPHARFSHILICTFYFCFQSQKCIYIYFLITFVYLISIIYFDCMGWADRPMCMNLKHLSRGYERNTLKRLSWGVTNTEHSHS